MPILGGGVAAGAPPDYRNSGLTPEPPRWSSTVAAVSYPLAAGAVPQQRSRTPLPLRPLSRSAGADRSLSGPKDHAAYPWVVPKMLLQDCEVPVP